MDAIEQLKDDLRAGRIDANRLVDLLGTLQRQLQAANQRIAELEKQLGSPSGSAKVAEPFSLREGVRGRTAPGTRRAVPVLIPTAPLRSFYNPSGERSPVRTSAVITSQASWRAARASRYRETARTMSSDRGQPARMPSTSSWGAPLASSSSRARRSAVPSASSSRLLTSMNRRYRSRYASTCSCSLMRSSGVGHPSSHPAVIGAAPACQSGGGPRWAGITTVEQALS